VPKQLSSAAFGLIKSFEGCHKKEGATFKPYICPGGVLTIGWGHTNHHGRQFDKNARWTQQQCDAALEEDLQGFAAQVASVVKVPLKQHQFDALVSFAYNVGISNLRSSTLLKKVNAGDPEAAALEFHKWKYSGGKVLPGLVRRRAAEALLFQGIPDLNFDGTADLMPQTVAIRSRTTVARGARRTRARLPSGHRPRTIRPA
jgi:lysozyme